MPRLSHWHADRRVRFGEDLPRYGLHQDQDVEVETLSFDELEQPAFNPEFDDSLDAELSESATEPGVVYVAKQRWWPKAQAQIAKREFFAVEQGPPFRGWVIFVVSSRGGSWPAQ